MCTLSNLNKVLVRLPLVCRLVLFRVFNGACIRTAFNPDEYWQGPEVAHQLIFGYGMLTWEWETCVALRSFLHPLIFAVPYSLLYVLGLDAPQAVALTPRLVQGALSGLTDFCTVGIASKVFGDGARRWTLRLVLGSWFGFFCSPRPFSNCLECFLTTTAVYLWISAPRIFYKNHPNLIMISILAATSILIRPTAAMMWLVIGVAHFRRLVSTCGISSAMCFMLQSVGVGGTVLALGTLMDSFFYGVFTSPLFNFFNFNALLDVSGHYGTHHILWYLFGGMGSIFLLFYPVYVFAIVTRIIRIVVKKNSHNNTSTPQEDDLQYAFDAIIMSVVFSICGLSLVPHKEFRFMMACLPYFHIVTSVTLARAESHFIGVFGEEGDESEPANASILSHSTIEASSVDHSITAGLHHRHLHHHHHHHHHQSSNSVASSSSGGVPTTTSPATDSIILQQQQQQTKKRQRSRTGFREIWFNRARWKAFLFTQAIRLGFFVHIVFLVYFSFFHQQGGERVLKYIRELPPDPRPSVLFITPCHATPFYSYLHKPYDLYLMDCTPAIDPYCMPDNQRDRFYEHPLNNLEAWLNTNTFSVWLDDNWLECAKIEELMGCLRYRFENEMAGVSPTHLVIWDAFMRPQFHNGTLAKWLRLNGWVERRVFYDSLWAERVTEKGFDFHLCYRIYSQS